MAIEIKNLNIDLLEINEGQLYGLPKNPRWIRDARFEALKKSIQDAPEMLSLREILVYPLSDLEGHEDRYIVIGGNMRFRACKELGYGEVPCKIIPLETSVKKLREYVIKDNNNFGQNDWEILSTEWENDELQDFGMELDYMAPTDDVDIDGILDEAAPAQSDDTTASQSQSLSISIEVPKEYEDNIEDIKAALSVTLEEWDGCKVK